MRAPTALERWARSGLLHLTGPEHGPPVLPGRDHLAPLGPVLATIAQLSARRGHQVTLDERVLAERAACWGWARRGPVSCGGTCRLLPAADGWVAVHLARADDVAALPAWLGPDRVPEALVAREVDPATEPEAVPWDEVAAACRRSPAAELAETAQVLGLPVAVAGWPRPHPGGDEQLAARWGSGPPGPVLVRRLADPAPVPGRPLVVDLSSLWAGPLCAHVLGLAGARVVKVESTTRPDGARLGPVAFFDLLHAGHEAVAVDFATSAGRAALHALVGAADVVIEGSRPRALDQLGLQPEAVLASRPGLTWVSITGYGRTGPWQQRVGFGDDCAAAGGLLVGDPAGDRPLFCGDAMADPVAGLLAAAAALAALSGGGGVHVDVALREAARFVADAPALPPVAARPDPSAPSGWALDGLDGPLAVELPSARPPAGPAPALGQHTAAVLAELGGP